MIHDALVLGGGPAGAVAAWLLARAGWSVVVVEKAAFPRRKVCGEFISATSMSLLDALGLREAFLDLAGPPVRAVAVYVQNHLLSAPMPGGRLAEAGGGRALGREHLDAMLLAGAGRAGAHILQPCTARRLEHKDGGYLCRADDHSSGTEVELRARIVIAAHGSWTSGALPTQMARSLPRPGDLLAFKAHYTDVDLPGGLMPLLAFPGGYGGMVRTDHARTSLSCCIRRDVLQQRRAEHRGRAADAVIEHLFDHCVGVRRALANARIGGPWLAIGPIRPGLRPLHRDGIFTVGNLAGEAHPIVAEGISMAMQGACSLAGVLIRHRDAVLRGELGNVHAEYGTVWRKSFVARVRAAALFAEIAMRPRVSALLVTLLERAPALLTLCARWSGKTRARARTLL